MKGVTFMSLITTLLVLLIGCGDLEPKISAAQGEQHQVPEESTVLQEETDEGAKLTIANYPLTDNVFQDFKWYSYNIMNHRVYPNFDVYLIQSKGQYYKFQIIDYYSKSNPNDSGVYTLRIEGENFTIIELELNASSCGAPTGGVSVACDSDEIYTLIDLNTKTISQMTAEDAVKSNAWDIGFKRSDVILNSVSLGGLGDVSGALVYRNKDFFNAFNLPRYQRLTDAYVNGGELETFNRVGRITK